MDDKAPTTTQATQKTQERTRDAAGAALRRMEGEATRMAKEATESFAVAGELTQHIVHTVLELEASAGQEGARCLAEQYRADMDLARECQEAAFRWQAAWPEMMRDPTRWYLHSLEENVALTRKCLGTMRQNAEAMTQCLHRMEASTEEASHALQKAFKDAADRTPDARAKGEWHRAA
jgi:hypothetical protein